MFGFSPFHELIKVFKCQENYPWEVVPGSRICKSVITLIDEKCLYIFKGKWESIYFFCLQFLFRFSITD